MSQVTRSHDLAQIKSLVYDKHLFLAATIVGLCRFDYKWLFHLQVVLTVSQLIWCRDVTEILEGDFDRLEGMKEFEQKCFKV